MLMLLALLLIVTCLVYRRTKRYKLVKLAAKLPGKFALPFVGNAIQFLGVESGVGITKKLQDFSDEHEEKGIVKVWMGQTLLVLVWEPKYLEIIANSPHSTSKGNFYLMTCDHSFQGVFPSPGGQHWKELRKPLTLSMTPNKLEDIYINIFNRRGNDFVDFIEKNREGVLHDAIHDISALLVDIFGETHLGVQLNELWDRKWDISAASSRLIKISIASVLKYGFYYWRYLIKFTSEGSVFEADKKKLMEFLKWVLNERRKTSTDIKDDRDYYTDFLLKRQQETNLSEEQTCMELADVLVAGSDTVSIVVSSAVLYLGMFPEIQEKAYQEQMEIFGDSNREPTISDIKDMKYLEMVFKETYRHMGNPGVMKFCTSDLKLGEYTIPEGTNIFPYAWKTRRDPKYWERPYEFYPEHFLPEAEASRNRYSYAQFGLGLRMCAGKLYGQISVMCLLSAIVRNFKISSPLKYDELQYGFNIFFEIKPGLQVKYERRR